MMMKKTTTGFPNANHASATSKLLQFFVGGVLVFCLQIITPLVHFP